MPYSNAYPEDDCNKNCPCAECEHPDQIESACGLDCWACSKKPEDFPCNVAHIDLDRMS